MLLSLNVLEKKKDLHKKTNLSSVQRERNRFKQAKRGTSFVHISRVSI